MAGLKFRLSYYWYYGIIVSMFIPKMSVASALPSVLPAIIMEHFDSIGNCNAYFCSVADATSFKRKTSSSSTLFKTSVISTGKEQIILDSSQHRLGLFVDTNCAEGITFLQQNGDLFNTSYRWLLRSKNSAQVLDTLKFSRLDVDSDLTLLTEIPTSSVMESENETSRPISGQEVSFGMIDVHRKHISSPFILEEYQRWIGNNVQSTLSMPDRRDLGGLQFTGSVWLPNMNIANLPRELLLNPAHAFNVDFKWRYGIALFLSICHHYLNCSMNFLQANCNDESSMIPCNGTAGVIDQVSKGMADFGIVPLTWDPLKYEVIDYSLPIMNIKHKYMFLRPKMVGSWAALIRPLSIEIWLLLFGLMILSVIAFRAVSSYDESSHHNDGWSGSVFLFVSALAQQGIPDNAGKLTTRIIYICILGVTFFVHTYYSTALLNSLLLPPPHSILFAQQLFDSRLAIGLEDSPILRARMEQNAGQDVGLKGKLAGKSDVFMEAVTGVERAVHEPFAVFGDELALYQQLWKVSFTFAEMCSVGLVDDEQHPKQASFILRRNSPYKEILRRGIIRSRERGAMHRLKTDWLPDVPECLWKTDAEQFGIQPHALAYYTMVIGLVAGVIILGGEKIVYNPKILKNSKPKDKLVNLSKIHVE